jgi:hypothetical protein
MGLTSPDKDGGFPVAVTGSTGAFLAKPLGRGPTHFAPSFGFMSSQASIGLLPDQGLVHDRHIGFDPKNLIAKLKLFDRLAVLVFYINLHRLFLTS